MSGRSTNVRRLLNAFLAGSNQGSLLPFAAEVAQLRDGETSDARDYLVQRSLLRRIKAEPQQQFKAHALMYLAHRGSSALDEVRGTHYQLLNSSDWPRHRDCICEMVAAARWLSSKACDPKGLDAFLCKAKETILALAPDEVWLTSQFDPTVQAHRRHLYVEARLLWILSRLRLAKRKMESYIESCERYSDWHEVARGKGLLAQIVIRSDYKRSLSLLREQADLSAKHDDLTGLAASLGVRACVLLHRNRLAEAEADLRERWAKLQEINSKQLLDNIDEDHHYLPNVWEELLSRNWTQAGQDEETYFNRSHAQEHMCDFSFLGSSHKSEEAFNIPFMLHVDSLARKPGSFEEAIQALSGKALAFLAGQERQLIDAFREEELCACYASQAALLRSENPDRALSVLNKLEALCLEIDDRHFLQTCWSYRAMLLPEHRNSLLNLRFTMGALLEFEEAAAYAQWDWGLLSALKGDREAARHYLSRAAYLMEELRYFGERTRVFSDLDGISGEPTRPASASRGA